MEIKNYKYILYIIIPIIFISIISSGGPSVEDKIGEVEAINTELAEEESIDEILKEVLPIAPVVETPKAPETVTVAPTNTQQYYKVTRVVDGDTIDVDINGTIERIRMIGINTPETVDPRKPVECFGIEASNQAKSLLSNKSVKLESDSSQGDRDKYSRLLRYIFLEDGTNFGLKMIQTGYAYEYTYDSKYKYQTEYKNAQKQAEDTKAGLWGDKCNGVTVAPIVVAPVASTTTQTQSTPVTSTETNQNNSCIIKGNINSKKEYIYHVPGCGSYNATIIDESKGEKWFCSEEDALDSGWRKALNC
ncbi:MAG: thermonuclease family protein [Candidatus Paceibacterota bacterium]